MIRIPGGERGGNGQGAADACTLDEAEDTGVGCWIGGHEVRLPRRRVVSAVEKCGHLASAEQALASGDGEKGSDDDDREVLCAALWS